MEKGSKMMANKMMFFLAPPVMVFAAIFLVSPAAISQNTKVRIFNGGPIPAQVWWNAKRLAANYITIRDVDGDKILPLRIPSIYTRGEKGVFTLDAGHTAVVTRNSGGTELDGTITFDGIPVCPCGGNGQPPCPQIDGFRLPKKLVNGVNQAEVSLNTGFESVDISCVYGANAHITILLDGGSPQWQNNITHEHVSQIKNKRVDVDERRDENCGEVGVFPFNATDCIQAPNPPCGQPICFHVVRDCRLDRQGSGGTVTIVFSGFTTP